MKDLIRLHMAKSYAAVDEDAKKYIERFDVTEEKILEAGDKDPRRSKGTKAEML